MADRPFRFGVVAAQATEFPFATRAEPPQPTAMTCILPVHRSRGAVWAGIVQSGPTPLPFSTDEPRCSS